MSVLPRLAIFFVSFLWGVSFVFTKPYLSVINPIVFTAYNFLIVGIIFAFIVRKRGRALSFRLREGILLGVFLFFLEVPQMIGLSLTTAANTAFLTSLGILLIPLLERLMYGRKFTLLTAFALLVAFAGMYLLTGGISNFNQGDIWISISAIGCLFYMVFTEHYEKEKGSGTLALCAQQFLTCGALALLVALLSGSPLTLEAKEASWLPLIALTFSFTFIPYLLLQWAERYANEVEITFYSILEPLIGGIAAWTIGAEIATPTMVLGGALIILSLAVSEFHRVKFKKPRKHALAT